MSDRPQIVPARSGMSEGAQDSTTPLVGCAQAITSRPPTAAGPGGMKMAPETAIGSPEGLVERKNAKGGAARTARSSPFERPYPDDRSRLAGSLARLDVKNRPCLLRERHAKTPQGHDGPPPTLKFRHFFPPTCSKGGIIASASVHSAIGSFAEGVCHSRCFRGRIGRTRKLAGGPPVRPTIRGSQCHLPQRRSTSLSTASVGSRRRSPLNCRTARNAASDRAE